MRALPTAFFARDSRVVARALLGKIVALPGAAGRIVETEAYRAADPASHSARGITPRSAVMFGPPGRVYVYFIYGSHEMLNFVTEPEGHAGAVLIRAIEPVEGAALMRRRRPGASLRELTNGPGKLCRALGVRLADTGKRLDGPRYRIFDDGFRPIRILASPRVGLSVAKERFWRYFVAGNPFVSPCGENALGRRLRGC